jgi:predicted Zn finger-like uncharacterized protein
MKVICQQCNATYAINDAAIPPKGARAQCPRCKHLQQVKRPDAVEGNPAATPAAPPAAPAAPRPAASSADPFADLDLGAPPPPPSPRPITAPRPAAVPAGGDPFANLDLGAPAPARAAKAPAGGDPFANFDLGGAAPPPPAPPPAAARAAPPARPNSDPFANLDLGGSPAPAPPPRVAPAPAPPPRALAAAPPPPPSRPESDPFANLDLGGGAAPPPPAAPPAAEAGPQALGKCGTCGKLIYDPFDAALGTCESCRAKQQGETSGPVAAPPTSQLPPVPAEARPPVRTGESRPTPPPQSRPRPPRNWTPVIAGGVAAAALGLGAFGVYRVKPAVLFPPKDTGPAIPAALQTRVTTAWALAFTDASGSVSEHIHNARVHMALDKTPEYRLAENEYKKAAILALGAKDGQALGQSAAGVVEAYLLGRGEFREKGAEAEMSDAMEGALQLAPALDSVQRAHAYYLLRDGHSHVEEARAAAQKAFDSASLDGKAEALLALGSTYLDSAQRAYDFLDRALQSDPKLRRAYYYRGLAAERVGHYAKAIADFRKRLEIDPDARRSLIEIARVDVMVGEVPQAKSALATVIANDPYAYDAKLALAVIGYQLDHADKAADGQLESMITADTKPKEPVLLSALVHQATIARERGDLKRAIDRIEKALQINDHYAPALFQRVLVGLSGNRPKDAESALSRLQESSPDGIRLDALQGRVAFAEDRASEGAAHFRDALTKNPQDLRSALLGAALASRAGHSEDAYQLMSKALEIDPLIDQRHRSVTEYYESRKSELAPISGGFDKEDRTLAQPIAYSGILRYFGGDDHGAEGKLNEAVQLEPGSVPALVFLAQQALDHKKFPKAQTYAEHALESERLSTLGKFLLGEADEALGSVEDARRLYSETLAQSPGFTGAMVREGLLLARANKAEDAQAMLLKVFFADADDTDACAGLFKLGY